MTLSEFEYKFDGLEFKTQLCLYNEWASKHDPDSMVFTMDEQFWLDNFQDRMQMAEAICRGDVDMNYNYIMIDNWGDLKSIDESYCNDLFDDVIDRIFKDKEIWKHYITED